MRRIMSAFLLSFIIAAGLLSTAIVASPLMLGPDPEPGMIRVTLHVDDAGNIVAIDTGDVE